MIFSTVLSAINGTTLKYRRAIGLAFWEDQEDSEKMPSRAGKFCEDSEKSRLDYPFCRRAVNNSLFGGGGGCGSDPNAADIADRPLSAFPRLSAQGSHSLKN
jgi:hypothetical protein